MVVINSIIFLELVPVSETESPELQGFFIRARKDHPGKKTGFLLNAVRHVELYHRPSKTRTIIKWLSDRLMEIEEYHPGTKRHPFLFRIDFSDASSHVGRGKPWIAGNAFHGKTVIIDWSKRDATGRNVISVRSAKNHLFSCTINRKAKTIDIQLEDLQD